MTLTTANRAAICKVLPLLRASTSDNERLAALRAIDRILVRAQADWSDVISAIMGGVAPVEASAPPFRSRQGTSRVVNCKAMLVVLKAILDRRSIREFGERAQQFIAGLTRRAGANARTGTSTIRLTSKQDAWLRGLASEVGITLPWEAI